MNKKEEKFQDQLLMECFTYINDFGRVLERIMEHAGNEFDLEYHFPNLDIQDMEGSCRNFLADFHNKEFNRINKKYKLTTIDEHMSFKGEIYD